MGAVRLKGKLCWDAVMAELIHQPGGSTRSNLGGKMADESFSNQEDLGNQLFLAELIINFPAHPRARVLQDREAAMVRGEVLNRECVHRKKLKIFWIIINCWTL